MFEIRYGSRDESEKSVPAALPSRWNVANRTAERRDSVSSHSLLLL